MNATVTSKGQITIPLQIRKILQIKPGDKIDFIRVESDRVIMMPTNHKLKELKGFLKKPKFTATVEQINEAVENAKDWD